MDQMTAITLPGSSSSGLADYGRLSASEMIQRFRAYAIHQKKAAEEILSAADSDFHVETYIGIHARKRREVVQAGRPALKEASK